MASPSPSPVQVAGSPLDSYRVDSPRRFSSSPQDLSSSVNTTTSTTRTGLVSSYSSNGQRSYGTVKQSFRRASTSVINYHPVEGDTLQGIALKFNVSVQDIERLNNIWNSDSMFCKPSIKIPVSYHSNNSSHTSSPSASPGMQRRNRTPSVDSSGTQQHVHSSGDISQLSNGNAPSSLHPQGPLHPVDPGDEVKSKHRPRQRRSESVTAECRQDGVKNIMDILNCADVQLVASKEFAERLGKKSSMLASAKDSYHRTPNGTHRESPAPSSIPMPPPQDREQSPKSKRRLHLKRVETTPEKIQESRDKLEENLFEL